MIFPKQVLSEALDQKIRELRVAQYPFQTYHEELPNDKSPAELTIMNFITFFDLKSKEMKDLVYQARKDIVNNCFKSEDLTGFVNEEKISQCIRNTELKYVGKHFRTRDVFYGNSI
jgi:hypothetical protein